MTPWTVATRLLCLWNSPGKNTGVGIHFLLQGIFPTWRSNLGLLNCRQILYWLSNLGCFWGLWSSKLLCRANRQMRCPLRKIWILQNNSTHCHQPPPLPNHPRSFESRVGGTVSTWVKISWTAWERSISFSHILTPHLKAENRSHQFHFLNPSFWKKAGLL